MQKQTILDDALYLDETKLGYKYTTDFTTGFHYIELPTNAYEKNRVLEQNAILFILEGSFSFSYDQYLNRIFFAGDMLFLPKSAIVTGLVMADVRFLYMTFDTFLSASDKQYVQQLWDTAKAITYDFTSLNMSYPIGVLVNSIIYLLENGGNCSDLHYIKHKEVFLTLRLFYSKEQLAQFFYPIIGKNFDFKNFILENYASCNRLEELVNLSNMSSNVFMRKFKKEFGISAYQWMLKQMCQKIQHKASKPGITIKEIMFEVGIDDYSHFNRVCKRHFNMTPKQLLTLCQSDI